jgi:hypothetical protein
MATFSIFTMTSAGRKAPPHVDRPAGWYPVTEMGLEAEAQKELAEGRPLYKLTVGPVALRHRRDIRSRRSRKLSGHKRTP